MRIQRSTLRGCTSTRARHTRTQSHHARTHARTHTHTQHTRARARTHTHTSDSTHTHNCPPPPFPSFLPSLPPPPLCLLSLHVSHVPAFLFGASSSPSLPLKGLFLVVHLSISISHKHSPPHAGWKGICDLDMMWSGWVVSLIATLSQQTKQHPLIMNKFLFL